MFVKMPLSLFTPTQMKLLKFINRMAERIQLWTRRYDLSTVAGRILTDEDCDALQAMLESKGWKVAKLVQANVNLQRNSKAIAFCDGRSLVEFKKMEGTDEYVSTIELIVEKHLKKTERSVESVERPKKLEEYVPG